MRIPTSKFWYQISFQEIKAENKTLCMNEIDKGTTIYENDKLNIKSEIKEESSYEDSSILDDNFHVAFSEYEDNDNIILKKDEGITTLFQLIYSNTFCNIWTL